MALLLHEVIQSVLLHGSSIHSFTPGTTRSDRTPSQKCDSIVAKCNLFHVTLPAQTTPPRLSASYASDTYCMHTYQRYLSYQRQTCGAKQYYLRNGRGKNGLAPKFGVASKSGETSQTERNGTSGAGQGEKTPTAVRHRKEGGVETKAES